jgi:hypothetical protein
MNETIKQILAKLEERQAILSSGVRTYGHIDETREMFQFALDEMNYVISIISDALPKHTNPIISPDPRPFLEDEVVFSKKWGMGYVDVVNDDKTIIVKFITERWFDHNGNSLDDPSNEAEAIYHCNEK